LFASFGAKTQNHQLGLYDQLINIFSFTSNDGMGWDVPFKHFFWGHFQAFCLVHQLHTCNTNG
jgi:hypothetical protein